MGIFSGIFAAKYCDICGNKISFMGNKKLKDGCCCAQCERKLSPYFTDRKVSTIEEIRYQIKSREENEKRLRQFRPTKSIGTTEKVLIDEEKMQFVVQHFKDKTIAGLDVVDCCSVMDCRLDIVQSKKEIKYRDSNGEVKSFNPQSFAYSYDFYISIRVNVPYIGEIRMKLNQEPVDNDAPTLIEMEGGLLRKLSDVLTGNRSNGGKTSNAAEVRSCAEYLKYEQMANDIIRILMEYRTKRIESRRVNTALYEKVECPWCGVKLEKSNIGICPCCCGKLDD